MNFDVITALALTLQLAASNTTPPQHYTLQLGSEGEDYAFVLHDWQECQDTLAAAKEEDTGIEYAVCIPGDHETDDEIGQQLREGEQE